MSRPVSRKDRLRAKQVEDTNRSSSNNFSVLDLSNHPDLEFMKLEEEVEGVVNILPYNMTTKKHPMYLENKKKDLIMEDYCLEVLVHTGIGPKKRSVVCPENYEKRCPICEEHRRKLDEEKQKCIDDGMNDQDAYKKASALPDVRGLKAKRRGMFVVIDKEDDDKMKILDYSAFWFLDNLRKKAKRKDVLLGDMMFEHKSVVFTPDTSTYGGRKGPGEVKDITFEKIGEYDFTEEDIDKTPKLDTMLILHSEEEIENMLFGNSMDDDDDDDDVVEVKSKEVAEEEVKKPRAARHAKEEEEEEAPKKRPRKRKEPEEITECPDGLEFGEDIDSVSQCDICQKERPLTYKACDAKYAELHPEG